MYYDNQTIKEQNYFFNFFNYIICFFKKEEQVYIPVEKLFEEEIDILFGIKK